MLKVFISFTWVFITQNNRTTFVNAFCNWYDNNVIASIWYWTKRTFLLIPQMFWLPLSIVRKPPAWNHLMISICDWLSEMGKNVDHFIITLCNRIECCILLGYKQLLVWMTDKVCGLNESLFLHLIVVQFLAVLASIQ